MNRSEQFAQMCSATFNIGCMAYSRGDMVAFNRARKLHRKYSHLYRQAVAREKKHG